MQPLRRVAFLLAVALAGSALAAPKKQPKSPPPPPVTTPDADKREPPPELTPVEKSQPEAVEKPAKKEEPKPGAATGAGALSDSPDKAKKEVAAIDRIGVSLDLYGEASRMTGEQLVNQFRADESFDYTAGPLAA